MTTNRLAAVIAGTLLGASVAVLGTTADAAGRRSLSYLLAQDTLERFEFEATHSLTTEFVRMPPEAGAYDVAGLQTNLAEVRTSLRGGMERFVGRVFRDRSLGVVSRLVEIEGTVDRGQGPGPLDLSGLDGKSISLRVFDSGEVLDSFGWTHMLGAGRPGDLVVEALLMQVFRLPNHVPKGDERLGLTYRLRFSPDPSVERNWDHVVAFEAAEVPPDCTRCVAMSYSGELKEVSRDKHPARPMVLDAQGRIEGTLLLGRKTGPGRRPMIENSWTIRWERTVRSQRESGKTRAEIKQIADITGRLYRGTAK